MKKFSYSFLALLFLGGAAQAQEAGETLGPGGPEASANAPAEPAPAAPEPAAPASSAADVAATVSDTEIDSFAKATVKLQAIQADTSIADDQKQSKMHAAVTESGLDPEKYNAIGKAAQADPALRAKVQTALAKHATPAG